jgi:uncharacterized RDD family membrane protein YckC
VTEPTDPVVHWEAPPPLAGPAPGVGFAPHGQRLVAYILDTVLISVLLTAFWLPLIALFPSTGQGTAPGPAVGAIIVASALFGMLVVVLYFPFFWATGGQTPGMRPFGLVVVRDRDGSRIGWGTAFLRLVGLYVAGSVFYLGYVWIFVDKRRRGWQDLIAGTVVIKRS